MGFAFEPLSGQILDAAVAVHTALGPGFLESIYDRALQVALHNRGIDYESQKRIVIFYEGIKIGAHVLDLVVGNEIVIELKAVKELEDIHYAQVRSYLKATGLKIGLLLNFNAMKLVIKRIVLDY